MANLPAEWWKDTFFCAGESSGCQFSFRQLNEEGNRVVHEFQPNVGCWDAKMINDSTAVFAWGEEGVRSFDLEERQLGDVFERPPGTWNQTRGITTMCGSDGNVYIAGGCNASNLGVWCFQDGMNTASLVHSNQSAGGNVYDSLFLTKTVESLVTVGSDDTLRFYDLNDYSLTKSITGCGNDRSYRLAYSPERDALIASKSGTSMCILDLRSMEFALDRKELNDTIEGVAVVDDDYKLIYGMCSGSIFMYDLRNMDTEVFRIQSAHGGSCMYCRPIIVDDEHFATGASDSNVRTWTFTGTARRNVALSNSCHALLNCGADAEKLVASRKTGPLNDESLELLMDKAIVPRNFELRLRNRTVETWKCLLTSSTAPILDDNFLAIDDDLDIDENVFCQFLLGSSEALKEDATLMDYFALFQHLGMKQQQLLICRKIEKLERIRTLLSLAHKSLLHWEGINDTEEEEEEEGEEEEAIKWKCAFTQSVFNRLVQIEKKNRRRISLRIRRRFSDVFVVLPLSASVSLNRLEYFDGVESRGDAASMFQIMLEDLQSKGVLSDVEVVSNDGRAFSCHLPVLVRATNIFYRMLSFPGAERNDLATSRRIQFNDMSGIDLENFLEIVYKGTMESEDPEVVLSLINLSDKFLETTVRALVMKKLPNILKAAQEDGTLQMLLQTTLSSMRNPATKKEVIKLVCAKTKLTFEFAYQLMQKSEDSVKMEAMLGEIQAFREEIGAARADVAALATRVDALE